MKKNRIIWITGISGVGKTTLAKCLKSRLKDFIWIDGDRFRKIMGNDIGYTLKDRNTNATRIINFVKFLNNEKKNILVSANLTSIKYKKKVKKFFKNLLLINIQTKYDLLIKRDTKKIYKKNKNVVGKDIKNSNFHGYDLIIQNNQTKKIFLSNIRKIIKKN